MLRKLIAAGIGVAVALAGLGAAAPAQAGFAAVERDVAHVAPGVASAKDPVASISGRLVDAAGEPLRGIEVTAQGVGHGGYGTDRTGKSGTFAIALKRSGTFELWFEGRPPHTTGQRFVTTVKVTVGKGKRAKLGTVRLKHPAGFGSSSIKLTTTGVYSHEEDRLYVHLKNARGQYIASTALYDDIDKKLSHTFTNVAAGRYRIEVPATGQSVVVNVGKGKTATKNLAVARPADGGDLRIRLKGAATKVWQVKLTDAKGRVVRVLDSTQIEDLPPGSYTVTGSSGSNQFGAKAKIRAGRTTTVTLSPEGGIVKGVLKAGSKGYPGKVILKKVGSSTRYEARVSDDGSYRIAYVEPGRYRVIGRDASSWTGTKFTIGGYADAYYGGTSLKSSRIITVQKGKTTRLSPVVFR